MKLSSKRVPGVGPPNAKIAIVGEAPGLEEDRLGQPFVGTAGNILNTMLNEAGILRNDCWVTNVVKHRPENNNISPLFRDAKHTSPTPKMIEYLEELKAELMVVKPNVAIALGGTAMWALTEQTQVMKRRGSIYLSTLVPGLKVVVALHPAAIARQWVPWRQVTPADFLKAKAESANKELFVQPREFITAPDFDTAMYELERLNKQEYLSFDIETRPYKIVSIAFSHDPDFAICIPFTRGHNNYWTYEEELEIWKAINKLLTNPVIKKVGQNVQYDIMYLARFHGICPNNIWLDTMVGHHELYPETPRGLDFLTSLWTREPYYKDEGKAVGGRVRDQDLWTYNCKDAAITLEVAFAVDEELCTRGLREQYEETWSYQEPLITMSLQGVRFDTAKQSKLIKSYSKKIQELQEALDNAVGEPINVNSNKQMVQLLYVKLGLPVYTGKTNRPSADMNALLSLRRKHAKFKPVLDIIIALRKLHKLKNTFLEVETDPIDGRIRCSYNIAGTETWRLSSSTSIFGGGTNLQNIPKGADEEGVIRKLFIPDEGKLMGAVDLSQAEARVVALLSGDEVAIHEFNEGTIDVHSAFAARLFGISYDEMMELAESNPKDFKYRRNIGKMVRHATNYGMTWAGLIKNCMKQGVYLEAREAKRLLKDAEQATPMLHVYHRNIREEMKQTRTLTTPLGKVRKFGGRQFGSDGDTTFRQAYAFIPQSTVGQLANIGLRNIYEHLGDKGVDLLLQVHDEIVFQFPKNEIELAHKARELMEGYIELRGRRILIPADLKVGESWGDLKEVR